VLRFETARGAAAAPPDARAAGEAEGLGNAGGPGAGEVGADALEELGGGGRAVPHVPAAVAHRRVQDLTAAVVDQRGLVVGVDVKTI
jgi:hypothetical protein